MNIIYIETQSILTLDIENALTASGCSLIYHQPPKNKDANTTNYLASLLTKVKTYSPAFIFSIDFYPFISLACGALGLPYVSWLVKGFDPDYFSQTICNDWNYVFAMDSQLCLHLKNLGAKNCFFLPLAAPSHSIDSVTSSLSNKNYTADISMFGTIIPRDSLQFNPLSASSELKDATKGYLEGCVACQHQFHSMPSICNNLPKYIWEDLKNGFPVKTENTLLTPQEYYDYLYFNPIITYADRDIHLSGYAKDPRYKKIHLYTSNDSYNLPQVQNCGWVDYNKDVPRIAFHSKINLVITHRNYTTGIPPIAWAIMGAKGFLLSNYQDDYNLLGSSQPILYTTSFDMFSKSAYYFSHEDERLDITEEIYKEIQKKHTYQARIQELFSNLC